eukprot:769131-Prymnesium_polylepis.2
MLPPALVELTLVRLPIRSLLQAAGDGTGSSRCPGKRGVGVGGGDRAAASRCRQKVLPRVSLLLAADAIGRSPQARRPHVLH